MSDFSESHEEVISYAKVYDKELSERIKDAVTINNVFVIPLHFNRLIPLDKKLWENPSFEYNYQNKMFSLLEAIEAPSLYEILVTPGGKMEGKESLRICAPFKIGVTEKDLGIFMAASTEYVDPTAKNAAMYFPQAPYSLNYKTGEVFIKGITVEEEALPEVSVN